MTSLSATANGPVPSGTAALPASDKAAGNCQSRQLRWTLVHLEHAQAASGDPAVARLTAQNGGGAACAFDGYPWFRVHVGKGLEVVAVAARTAPARLVLAPGHSAVVDLHYSEVPGTGGICYFPSDDLAQGQVLAPHAAPHEVGLGLRMTDAHGKRMAIAVCENHMWMSAPVMK
ncbi:DUF4232 domain-containing protein [Kitasatospora sp. NPDC001175]|uniref:DUF4232 domain-containing protein n=1 Tax=Kitasatospora cystarginea TaxID=58350 RepID=A0ABN3E500_9ACTN